MGSAENDEIPIVMICDNRYVFPTRIVIRSLFRSAHPGTRYRVFILGVGLSEKNQRKLRKENPAVEVLPLENQSADICGKYTHVSRAALYKFDIPELFPMYDKILYLDSDLLIRGDLSRMFATDLSGVYAGVVKELAAMEHGHHTKMGHNAYFNSGIMLLNLELCRKDGIRQKLWENKKNEKWAFVMDQDVLNQTFHEQVRYLSFRYNFMCFLSWFTDEKLHEFFGEEAEQVIAAKNGVSMADYPVIVHFFSKRKPWRQFRYALFMRAWWQHLTPWERHSRRIPLFFTKGVEKMLKKRRILETTTNQGKAAQRKQPSAKTT